MGFKRSKGQEDGEREEGGKGREEVEVEVDTGDCVRLSLSGAVLPTIP
jgi:hypothetical protein